MLGEVSLSRRRRLRLNRIVCGRRVCILYELKINGKGCRRRRHDITISSKQVRGIEKVEKECVATDEETVDETRLHEEKKILQI